MINWSEQVLKVDVTSSNYDRQLPQTKGGLDKVYNNLLHRLAFLANKTDGSLNLPKSLLNRTQINGIKVFKDDKLRRYKFMRCIL